MLGLLWIKWWLRKIEFFLDNSRTKTQSYSPVILGAASVSIKELSEFPLYVLQFASIAVYSSYCIVYVTLTVWYYALYAFGRVYESVLLNCTKLNKVSPMIFVEMQRNTVSISKHWVIEECTGMWGRINM